MAGATEVGAVAEANPAFFEFGVRVL
ncbi:MAG: hypothetical protein RIR91_1280, partial [Verrucomicrobiota bacterium]